MRGNHGALRRRVDQVVTGEVQAATRAPALGQHPLEAGDGAVAAHVEARRRALHAEAAAKLYGAQRAGAERVERVEELLFQRRGGRIEARRSENAACAKRHEPATLGRPPAGRAGLQQHHLQG